MVLFLMVIPNLFNSFVSILNEKPNNIFLPFYVFDLGIYSTLSWLIKSLQVSFPVLLLIYINNESFSEYGFNKITVKNLCKSLIRLLGLTLLFLIALIIIIVIIMAIFYGNNYTEMIEKSEQLIKKANNSPSMILLNIVSIILMAFTEELCFRSYLYINLNKIIKNKWMCIILINILFASYHIYQGIMAVMTAFVMGLVFSIEFKRHNNIYSISIFHTLRNIISFIM
jgi:membrane protease YdiL (CAAX protease family)